LENEKSGGKPTFLTLRFFKRWASNFG